MSTKSAKTIPYQSMLLPDPATKSENMSGRSGERMKNCTFAVGPKERSFCLPFIVDRPFKEPSGGHLLVDFTCFVVVSRWVRRRKPLLNLLSHSITCSSRLSLLIAMLQKDKPLMLFKSSEIIFCIVTCTSSQLYLYTVPSLSLSYQEPLEHCSLMHFHLKGQTFSTI
jgi:hypothetical protein